MSKKQPDDEFDDADIPLQDFSEPEQPAPGQGDLCTRCQSCLPKQRCARQAEMPDLYLTESGEENCDLFT